MARRLVTLSMTSRHSMTSQYSRSSHSKIANVSLARSGTGCFIAVPIWQQWTSTS